MIVIDTNGNEKTTSKFIREVGLPMTEYDEVSPEVPLATVLDSMIAKLPHTNDTIVISFYGDIIGLTVNFGSWSKIYYCVENEGE